MGELLRHNGPALLACAVIVVRLARHRRHHRTATSTMGWIVLLAIALSLTVKAPLVYQAVSELTGIPNIGRLIDHGCILVAGWGALGILLHINHPEEARQRSLPHAVWIALAFTGMCVLFAFTRTPVDDVRFAGRYGRTPGVLEYWLVYLAGMLPAFLNSARLAARYAGMATDSAVRLGLRLISIGVLCSVAYHIHKGLFFAARRFGIHYPKALSMPLDRYLTLAAAILVLIGVTLPNWRSPDVFGACRKLLRLRPLWLALYRVNPRIALVPPRPLVLELLNLRDLELRLYRRVVEIRDGRLALREHIDPRVAEAARAEAAGRGLAGQKLDALVEATTLYSAMQAARAGNDPPSDPSPVAVSGGHDLAGDIAFLDEVALAYRFVSRKHRRCELRERLQDMARTGRS
ncbi:hypothetical protein JOF56_010177 [Kibdelosporangium banguiense]|uniref:DUF6545 domain-containing protein n=1 Tax=Kibdelosporangium banguiense TaxID=1365924 RepID=A0ABS4TZF3_9PSEU|nr:MAB_1171c family putative transporter [Kibdelosporangium banguiense]MBP2329792.1 hypothetical protein [Kibdelosporangium banguiense]